jgi:uncharacterized protein (TIGR03083 family)
MNHAEYCDALELEVERFAVAMSLVSGDTIVATCPGWTVDDAALHLGAIHRWAEELVRTRSTARLPRATPSLDEVAVSPAWIRQGGQQLVETLRAADPNDEMWAWGLDQRVRFWSRRQVHETLVHRMDVELAGGIEPTADGALAIDAIDEFLCNMQKVTNASAEEPLRGNGERLVFRAGDSNAVWAITLRNGGFDLVPAMGDYDALVEGPSLELLLVIVRRRTLHDGSLVVTGDGELVDFWLANSAFG